jgi:hypothetical protein
VIGDLDDEPREHEVLFDLVVGRPWRDATPSGDERGGDHRSGAISALSRKFQRGST